MDVRGAEASAKQLRDDLITLLIAGHETTGSMLTWATWLLAQVCCQRSHAAWGVLCFIEAVRDAAARMRLGLCYEGLKAANQGSLARSMGGAQRVANACCCSHSADCCIRL